MRAFSRNQTLFGADFQSSIERWGCVSLGVALVLIHILGERLAGMLDAPASRSAGILPALANEMGKGGPLAAILSHPIGR